MTDFENVGVLQLTSTGRSFRIEMKGGLVCYVGIRAVGEVLYAIEKTATIFKVKGKEESGEGKEQSVQGPGEAH